MSRIINIKVLRSKLSRNNLFKVVFSNRKKCFAPAAYFIFSLSRRAWLAIMGLLTFLERGPPFPLTVLARGKRGDTFSVKKLKTFLLIVSLALFLLKNFLAFALFKKIPSSMIQDKKKIKKQYKFIVKKVAIKIHNTFEEVGVRKFELTQLIK